MTAAVFLAPDRTRGGGLRGRSPRGATEPPNHSKIKKTSSRKDDSMNQDTFKKAQEIQEQLELFRKAYDSISKSGSELRISWSESNYCGESIDRYFRIRNCDMGEVRTVLANYFLSRIAELEKEFEAL